MAIQKTETEIKNIQSRTAAYLQAALFLYQISDGRRLFIDYEICSLGFLYTVFDG
jgi:hypothetical protein